MNENNQTVRLNARGLVQGVGFRWSTIKIAESLDISGWVKNEPDGSVSIVASGSPDNLTAFIAAIQKSPNSFAKVEHLQINYISKRVNKGLNVKY